MAVAVSWRVEVGNAKERERGFTVTVVDTHEALVGFQGDMRLQIALETEGSPVDRLAEILETAS
jgi:hypothetical protein